MLADAQNKCGRGRPHHDGRPGGQRYLVSSLSAACESVPRKKRLGDGFQAVYNEQLGSHAMSNGLPGAEARRPRPLEVESAQMAGDVDDFADEVQPRNFARLHGLGRSSSVSTPPGGDLGLFVAFGARRVIVQREAGRANSSSPALVHCDGLCNSSQRSAKRVGSAERSALRNEVEIARSAAFSQRAALASRSGNRSSAMHRPASSMRKSAGSQGR